MCCEVISDTDTQHSNTLLLRTYTISSYLPYRFSHYVQHLLKILLFLSSASAWLEVTVSYQIAYNWCMHIVDSGQRTGLVVVDCNYLQHTKRRAVVFDEMWN